jgi:hypothetical protein
MLENKYLAVYGVFAEALCSGLLKWECSPYSASHVCFINRPGTKLESLRMLVVLVLPVTSTTYDSFMKLCSAWSGLYTKS